MLRISIITSYRFLSKSKTYTTINLLGLVLGLTAAFILFTFLINELSFNTCFRENKKLYRVLMKDRKRGQLDALTALIVAPNLEKYFPEIDRTARIVNLINITGQVSVCRKNIFYSEPRFISADPSIIDLLSIKMIAGSSLSTVDSSYSLLISEQTSKKYFGSINPVGRNIKIKAVGNIFNFKINGVYHDLPWNSSYQADFISGIDFLNELLRDIYQDPEAILTSYRELATETIIRLKDDISIKTIEQKLPAFSKTNKMEVTDFDLTFQSLSDIYLNSENIRNDFLPKGNKANLITYTSLAIFILLLAGINYSILSTARAALRFKEIGVKKVLGASRKQLRYQILTESILLTFLAFPLAFLLLGLINPFIKELYGYEIQLYASNMAIYFLLFAGITILIGVLSGVYVALYLSALNPLHALKMRLFSFRKFNFGKVFTVFQLFITLSLLISFITVYRQIRYCFKQDMRLNKENLLIVSFNPGEFKQYSLLKKSIATKQHINSVSGISISFPSTDAKEIKIRTGARSDSEIAFESYSVDYNFFKTLGIKFFSGRDFDINEKADPESCMIINETAAKELGHSSGGEFWLDQFRIIGIVKDFHLHTFHDKIRPALFFLRPDRSKSVIVRYQAGFKNSVIEDIEKTWRQLAPTLPFNYLLFDKELDNLYTRDKNFQFIVASFTILAFLITGMGLFGLAILLSERKMREVAIRKVFGASNPNIVYEMQKEFYIYITIAAIFGVPFTWFLMDRWLNTFFYHVDVSWYLIVVAIISVAVFVSAILYFRTRKVLINNPLSVLKYE